MIDPSAAEAVNRPFIEHQLAAIAYKIGLESTMERRCPELIEAYKELLKVYERTLDLPNNKPPDAPARVVHKQGPVREGEDGMRREDNAEMWERWDQRLRMKEYAERDTVTLQSLAIMSDYHPPTASAESEPPQSDQNNRHERMKGQGGEDGDDRVQDR